jgi:hypothetical protein
MTSIFLQQQLSQQFKTASVKIDTLLTALDNGWHIKKINENEYQLRKSIKEYSDNDVLIRQLFKNNSGSGENVNSKNKK